jgi:hypothetical protein
MITQQQFYVYYTDYTLIIDGMNEKLSEAKRKNPEKDFKSQEEIIKTVKFLRQLFHTMYHDQQSIENQSGKIIHERHSLITKCSRLEKELETLKSNIDL